ncbi:hypothetical protein [Luteolibacter marinus]|uniref:hypothetical protein n=1 Tax=Luteolibacter marinus TaxID=2776705 RepID=UPI001866F3D5|nr:hypothetical protein [Luteolibacter marinus]
MFHPSTPTPRRPVWPRKLVAWLLAVPMLLATARAHHGFDSSTSVRLLENQTVVIVRMSPALLSVLLGPEAPADWTDAAFQDLRPRLIERSKTFFTLRSADAPLAATSAKASLELQGEIAFILKYPAVSFPATVTADFCKDFGPAFQGTLTVRGRPLRAIDREGPVLATLDLSPTRHTLEVPAPGNSPAE